MAKYQPLTAFLQHQPVHELPMTFTDVEHIIGAKLPASAHTHPAWWENDPVTHVQAKAWLNAGFQTAQIDKRAKTLVFKRIAAVAETQPGSSEPQHGFKHEPKALSPRRHPAFGALKGTFTVEPGYDLTQPAMPEWADLLDEKYGPEKPK